MFEGQRPTFGLVEKERFFRGRLAYGYMHAMLTLLLKAAINAIYRMHVDDERRQQFWVKNCGQTVANSDMVTIDSL